MSENFGPGLMGGVVLVDPISGQPYKAADFSVADLTNPATPAGASLSSTYGTKERSDVLDVAGDYGTTAADINEAITDANANYLAGAGPTVVHLRAGVWNLNAIIVPKSGVTLRGAGRRSTILKPTGLNPAIKYVGNAGARLTAAAFTDFTIDCSAQAGAYTYMVKGVYIMFTSAVRFERVRIVEAYATAFGLDYPTDQTVITDCTAINPGRGMGGTIEGGNGFGVLAGSANTEDFLIDRCYASGAKNIGFLIERNNAEGYVGRGYRITNSIAETCTRAGFCDAGVGAIISECNALGNIGHGFLLGGKGDDPNSGSQLYPPPGAGRLANSLASLNGGHGVYFDATQLAPVRPSYSITAVTARSNVGGGIVASSSVGIVSGLSITGCTTAENGGKGISTLTAGVGRFDDLHISGNTTRLNTGGGVVLASIVNGGMIAANYSGEGDTDTTTATLIGVDTGGSAPVRKIAHLGTAVSTADASAYTFPAQPIGAADATRQVIVVVGTKKAAPSVGITSITIGGVAAAVDVVKLGTAGSAIAIAKATVPTGTTADVVVTWAGAVSRCHAAIYRAQGTWTLQASASAVANAGLSVNLSIPSATTGYVLGGAFDFDNAPGVFAWSGVTEKYDELAESCRASGGLAVTVGAATITATYSTIVTDLVGVAANYV